MDIHLPSLNAGLNTLSAGLLLAGYLAIRKKKEGRHRALMTGALITSTLFLISYLYYHANVGSVRYQGTGLMRPVYFSILLTHTVLATAIVPLVITTVILAMRKKWESHKRVARWTWPLWMYVSVTGVLIYLMLYRPWLGIAL